MKTIAINRQHHTTLRGLLLAVLLTAGMATAHAADYVFKTAGGYYIGMNAAGTGFELKTTLDSSCIWSCANNLDNTSRALYNFKNTSQYLIWENSTFSVSGTSSNVWRSGSSGVNNYLRHYASGTNNGYPNYNNGVGRGTVNATNSFRIYTVSSVSEGNANETGRDLASSNYNTPTLEGNSTINTSGNYEYSATITQTKTYTISYSKEITVNYNSGTPDSYTYAYNATSAPSIEAVTINDDWTQSWTVTDDDEDHDYATIDSTTGILAVSALPSTGSVTLTITYTATKDATILTGTKTVTIWSASSYAEAVEGGTTGVSGGVVTLNDYEPHEWSYYSDPLCPIRSLSPANVKITYHGNGEGTMTNGSENGVSPTSFSSDATGVQVGVDAACSTFVYYKTLERAADNGATYSYSGTAAATAAGRCAYTTIPNPFSVRPKAQAQTTNQTVYIEWYYTNSTRGTGTLVVSDNNGTTYLTRNITAAGNSNISVPQGVTLTFAFTRSYNNNNNHHSFGYTARLENSSGTQIASVANGNTAITDNQTYTVVDNAIWRGFYKWRVNSVSGGEIFSSSTAATALATPTTTSSDNVMLDAETTYYFAPYNEYGMTVELEALWAQAYLTTSYDASALNGDVGYERNFVVLTGTEEISSALGTAATISSLYPNGTTTGSGSLAVAASSNSHTLGSINLSTTTKFEYIALSGTGTVTARNQYLIFGRGISTANTAANAVRGVDGNSYRTPKMRIESGKFGSFHLICSGTTNYTSGTVSGKVTFGCDYDRAKKANLLLRVTGPMYGAEGLRCSSNGNRNNLTYDWTFKSGWFLDTVNLGYGKGGEQGVYASSTGSYNNTKTTYYYDGKHAVLFEGGVIASIALGMDGYGATTGDAAYLRMTGGHVCGAIYGAAEYADAAGDRRMIITGGTIDGWIAGGCNGTHADGGATDGNTYLYVGGNVLVGKEGTHIGEAISGQGTNGADGGNIFGAGCGIRPHANNTYTGTYYENGFKYNTVGQVNNSTVVVADEADILENVYGGGNFGMVKSGGTSDVHILGGKVRGKVFGGSNMQQGQTVHVTMRGGQVYQGVYGGSNDWGYGNGNITVDIVGGTVGDPVGGTTAHVHGGGYGNNTVTMSNVEVTIGDATNHTGPTIYGDVYGGSAMGTVNGGRMATSGNTNNNRVVTLSSERDAGQHTYVTVHGGTITGNAAAQVGSGSVYGGGLGSTAPNYAANVNGEVRLTVTGGTMNNTFGCNNLNGMPQCTVKSTITGGTIGNVYGGGNAAPYGDGNLNGGNQAAPHVLMKGGHVTGNVFGGGLGTSATVSEHSHVQIIGSSHVSGNVYGGGNAATVTGNTKVQIGGNE